MVFNYAARHEDVWGSEGIAPPYLIPLLDEGELSASRPSHFTPEETAPVGIGYEIERTPDLVRTLRREDKSRSLAWNRTPTSRSSIYTKLN
jgi:hypothetical protein